ncbi:TrmB family transcriptional regulator sugar-binding domain-containing protein [Natrialbaceae archaeon GCM10025810]|uniref:TrmB family transcriptional regulator sugar-binding domain-containing protein n=1 Tax=Halovalidus salilacus TaxID=3075124 RepID=UPI00360D2449
MIGPAQPQREQFGVWTVTGREAVAARIDEFIADADDQIVYMAVDELLTDEHLDQLRAAEDRGVDLYIAGISDDVRGQIQETVPSAELFETLWEWRDTPAGSLLITDEETVLVSSLVNGSGGTNEIEETAIWGAGDRNSLVVVLRAIFTWRLGGERAG